MEKTIQVTGTSQSNIRPDSIRLIISINETQKDDKEARKICTQKTERLKNCFTELGFDKKDLKTISFFINPKYKNIGNKDQEWEQKCIGYECSHRMKIEFECDNDLFGKILNKVEQLSIQTNMQIHYYVKDIEAVKKELMEKAVLDAMTKAKILADAANISLNKIVKIDYMDNHSFSQTQFLQRGNHNSIDFEPNDIELTDSVVMAWSIVP